MKPIIYNISDGGYAEHGAVSPTIKALTYLVGITEQLSGNQTDQYANGELVGSVKGIQKITGELRTTGPEPDLEALAGLEIATDVGVARTIGAVGKRADIHFAYNEVSDAGVVSKVKVWLFNVELGKPTRTHETKRDNVTLAEYAYPYTAYGIKLKNAAGTADYVDDNGMEVLIHDVTARTGDDNYDTFFSTVPVPKKTA